MGWNIAIPDVHLRSGSFHRSGKVRGAHGGSLTISGQIDGDQASGTFSDRGIHDGPASCLDLSLTWRATWDPTAEPDPAVFGMCGASFCYNPSTPVSGGQLADKAV